MPTIHTGDSSTNCRACQILGMRDWIADCTWRDDFDLDDDDWIDELSDAAVIRGVEDHYEGGVRQFLADA